MKFHHFAIICNDKEKASEHFSNLFQITQPFNWVYDPIQDVELCLIYGPSNYPIELIYGEKMKGLQKRGINYYHMGFEVNNIEESIEHMENNGYMKVSDINPAILFSGKRVVFLYSPFGLVELIER